MPQRTRVRRFPSPEIQGEDSWVVISKMTVGEIRASRKKSKGKNPDLFELTVQAVAKHVLEWNWVDDDGAPLPQPKDNPAVIDQLAEFETIFLGNLIAGSEAAAKN